jgi:shikimate 5-dehydrogenase
VQRKVFLLGHSDQLSRLAADYGAAFGRADAAAVCETLRLDEAGSGELLTQLTRAEEFLGLQLATRYSSETMPLCQDLSPAALSTGVVDLAVRYGEGRLYGDFVLVSAIRELLRSEGVGQVRTALILGAGHVARAAVAALKDMGCARYVIGHRSPRRQSELAHQFRGIRRQITFFPLDEMVQFFSWAEASGAFESSKVPPTETGGAERDSDKGAKRWELLINTTPLGQALLEDTTPTANHNFMSTVNRVLDVASGEDGSTLVTVARRMGVPAYTGTRLRQIHADLALQQWLRALRGEDLDIAVPMPRKKAYMLRRHRRG